MTAAFAGHGPAPVKKLVLGQQSQLRGRDPHCYKIQTSFHFLRKLLSRHYWRPGKHSGEISRHPPPQLLSDPSQRGCWSGPAQPFLHPSREQRTKRKQKTPTFSGFAIIRLSCYICFSAVYACLATSFTSVDCFIP